MYIEPGTFICFQGRLGSGKTLTMSYLGALCKAGGQNVYANYRTIYAEPINSIRHLFSISNAVLLLDELQSILDSREFKKNGDITQWILIVRKLGLSILYTTQFLGQVDLRVRHVTEQVWCCQKAKLAGRRASRVSVVDWAGESGKVSRSFVLPHSQQLYGLYDTKDFEVKLTKDTREATFSRDKVIDAL